jgi:hypothetical protein
MHSALLLFTRSMPQVHREPDTAPFCEIGALHVYHGMLRAVLDSRLR